MGYGQEPRRWRKDRVKIFWGVESSEVTNALDKGYGKRKSGLTQVSELSN